MKTIALFWLSFIVSATFTGGCVRNSPPSSSSSPDRIQTSSPQTPSVDAKDVVSGEAERRQEVPVAFRAIDFKNFSYPTNLRGQVDLKDGERIYENPEGGGGDTFEFRDVQYADMTGDGKEEAIVNLVVVSCGGSCDGGSDLFYFYGASSNRPRLLARLETGSAAYDECGLKSFHLRNSSLTLELFRVCRFRGKSFQSLYDQNYSGGKFEARSFTRFQLEFDGRKFAVRKREVFPFAQGDVKNYATTFKVSSN